MLDNYNEIIKKFCIENNIKPEIDEQARQFTFKYFSTHVNIQYLERLQAIRCQLPCGPKIAQGNMFSASIYEYWLSKSYAYKDDVIFGLKGEFVYMQKQVPLQGLDESSLATHLSELYLFMLGEYKLFVDFVVGLAEQSSSTEKEASMQDIMMQNMLRV